MRLVLTVVLLSILTVVPPTVSAPAGRSDRIAYLHLQKAGDTITLDSIQVLPGRLKVPRQSQWLDGDLQVSVRNDTGERLSWSTIADPSYLRLEYVDEQGRLQVHVEQRDTVHFTVRVPYAPTMRTVDFTRVTRTIDADSAPRRIEESLGVITLPIREATHD